MYRFLEVCEERDGLELNKHLLAAVQDGDFSKVKAVLNRCVNINAQDKDGCTPLHYAAAMGNLEVVKYIVEKGADFNMKDNFAWTPLHLASMYGKLEVVKYLKERGASLNVVDKFGATPLHSAAVDNRLEVVRYMVEEGVDVNAKDHYGRTPLDLARRRKYNNIVDYLEKLNVKGVPKQRNRRHHHGDHNRHHMSRKPLSIDSSNQPEIAVSSSARPSSWINNLFSWMKSSIGGLLSSKPAEILNTTNSISQVDAQIDVKGTIMLLDLLIRRVTGQKYISTVDQSISPLEAQGYALNITNSFEKVVEQAALKGGISIHRLNIDYMGMQKEITRKVMSGKFNEISGILKSYVEKACPGEEAGKLSPKKFNKCMLEFNKGLDVVLNQSIERNRDSRLEVDGAKQMSLEPQSYLSNASVHSHSKVSTCLSEIGVTKLGGNLNR